MAEQKFLKSPARALVVTDHRGRPVKDLAAYAGRRVKWARARDGSVVVMLHAATPGGRGELLRFASPADYESAIERVFQAPGG